MFFSESPNTQIRFPIKFIIIPPIVAASLLTKSEQPPFETRTAAKGDSRRGKINDEKAHDLFPASLALYTKRPLPVPHIAVDDPCRIGADLRRQIGTRQAVRRKKTPKSISVLPAPTVQNGLLSLLFFQHNGIRF